jgi:DNA-binding CsgD family transcriptional regulator
LLFGYAKVGLFDAGNILRWPPYFLSINGSLRCLSIFGISWSFICVLRGLENRSLSPALKTFFGMALIIVAFVLGAGVTLYIIKNDISLLVAIRDLIFKLSLSVLIVFLFFFLVKNRSTPTIAIRRRNFRFALFYLTAYCFLFIIYRFSIFTTPVTFLIDIIHLTINIFPLIWLKKSSGVFQLSMPVSGSYEKSLFAISRDYDLSKREIQIIELILQGKSNKEISETLFISLSTVKNHIYNLYQKLRIKNRGQLMVLLFNETSKSS